MTRGPSVWCSKHYFFIISYFHFCNFIKKNQERFECVSAKDFARFYEKKYVILGTSDAWSTSHLSHRPNEPAYHIVDWRILNLSLKGIFFFRHLANWKLLLTLGRQHQKRIASFNEKTSRFDGKTWKQSQIICRIRNFLGIFLFIRSEIAVKPTYYTT